MDHTIVDIWVKGLKTFFENRDPNLIDIAERFKQAVDAQTKLRLDQIIYGRISYN